MPARLAVFCRRSADCIPSDCLRFRVVGESCPPNNVFRYLLRMCGRPLSVLQIALGLLLLTRPCYSQITAAEQQALLKQHNVWRREFAVPELTWSPALAAYAQAW